MNQKQPFYTISDSFVKPCLVKIYIGKYNIVTGVTKMLCKFGESAHVNRLIAHRIV